MVGGASCVEALLASIHLMKIYDAAIQAYDCNCSITGTPETGFYIQLVVGKQGGSGILPQEIDGVPVAIIYANFEERLQAARAVI
jgi:hypothetical protein